MAKLTDMKQRQTSHVCLYGDPKSGKSTLAADLANHGYKLVWISVDNGHDVLFKLPPAAQENVDVIVLPDTRDFPVAIDTCLKLFTGTKVDLCEMHGQVNCSFCRKENHAFSSYQFGLHDKRTIVVLDHMSQVADSAWNLITKNFDIMKDITAQKKESQDNYMKLGFLMNKLLTQIQQAPFHVICISQPIETEMEDGSKKLVPRIGSVPFSKNAASYFDHIIYTELQNKKHKSGSATTYKISAVTGSRRDIAIESMGESASLTAFFDGTIVNAEQQAAVSAATSALTGAAEKLAALKG